MLKLINNKMEKKNGLNYNLMIVWVENSIYI